MFNKVYLDKVWASLVALLITTVTSFFVYGYGPIDLNAVDRLFLDVILFYCALFLITISIFHQIRNKNKIILSQKESYWPTIVVIVVSFLMVAWCGVLFAAGILGVFSGALGAKSFF